MKTAILTDHAKLRAKERLGWNEGALQRMATKALNEGLTQSDVAGRMRRYLDGVYLRHPGKRAHVHSHAVFIFGGETLVTVMNLPHNFWRAAERRAKR